MSTRKDERNHKRKLVAQREAAIATQMICMEDLAKALGLPEDTDLDWDSLLILVRLLTGGNQSDLALAEPQG